MGQKSAQKICDTALGDMVFLEYNCLMVEIRPLHLKTCEVGVILKLNRHKIPLDDWGKGGAKSTKSLATEVLLGESVLVETKGGLVRQVGLVHIDVWYKVGDDLLQLVEKVQIFSDGRRRRRGLTGVNEKLMPNESIHACAKRALEEELGLFVSSNNIIYLEEKHEARESPSYPGLTTEFTIHEMEINLSGLDFKNTGYTEIQPDKTTYFSWQKVEPTLMLQ